MVNSGRQIGGVFGTAILVLILGKGATTGDPTQYYHLWWVAAATCAAAVVTSLGLTPVVRPRKSRGLSLAPSRQSPSGKEDRGRPPVPGGWPLVVTPAKRPGRDPTRLRTVGRQFAVDNLRALTEIMGASDITSVLTNGGKCR